jgi:Leucine-rich repeat (LRR) protein
MLFISKVVLSQNNTNYKDSIFYSLKDAFKTPLNVYALKLSNQHIYTDTLNLSVFTNLVDLDLSYDSLVQLPSGLDKLTKLKVLDISGNNFTLLSEQITLIPNLQELYLNNEKYLDFKQSFKVINKITHLKRLHLDSNLNIILPKNIALNDSIEYISMRYDGLEQIPKELSKFTHLKVLDLDGNIIKSIDKSFLKNKEIESLRLSISPQFKFKKSFSILSKEKQLKNFSISNSNLSEIPEEISLLKNITSLSLQNNHLTYFPAGVLNIENLKYLDISGNDFKSLPATLSSLSKLETLNLSGERYLNFDQSASIIRNLPSLHLVQVDNYDYTFDSENYSKFLNNSNYIEMLPAKKQSEGIHLFKS